MKCQKKKDCVASALVFFVCQHLMNNHKVGSEATSDQCPTGIENYAFGKPGPGVVYAGPCGV